MWNDRKVTETFSHEDKTLWFYLLTNDRVNNLGCYKISFTKMSVETGLTKQSLESVLIRFRDYHQIISYDEVTSEILIKNFSKYNWTRHHQHFLKNVEKSFNEIKSLPLKVEMDIIFKDFYDKVKETKKETVLPFASSKEDDLESDIKAVVDVYNRIMNARLTYKNKATNSLINARLSEGYTIDDFEKVIQHKNNEWIGTDMAKYLVPNTLFSPSKFSNYLLQSSMGMSGKSKAERDKANDAALWAALES